MCSELCIYPVMSQFIDKLLMLSMITMLMFVNLALRPHPQPFLSGRRVGDGGDASRLRENREVINKRKSIVLQVSIKCSEHVCSYHKFVTLPFILLA